MLVLYRDVFLTSLLTAIFSFLWIHAPTDFIAPVLSVNQECKSMFQRQKALTISRASCQLGDRLKGHQEKKSSEVNLIL